MFSPKLYLLHACRAEQVQMRLAEALSTEWIKNCQSSSSPRTNNTAQDLAYAPSGGSPNDMPQPPGRVPGIDMLDPLDETKVTQGVGASGKFAGLAGHISTQNQENESAGNGRFHDQMGNAVPLGSNQSAFNHGTGSIQLENPVMASDFIQSVRGPETTRKITITAVSKKN